MLHVCALTVIPLSLSTSSLSRICLLPPFSIVPVSSKSRSLRVLFPWSTCATIQKFRNRSRGIASIRRSKSVLGFEGGAAHRAMDVVNVRLKARQVPSLLSGELMSLMKGRRHRRIKGCWRRECAFVVLVPWAVVSNNSRPCRAVVIPRRPDVPAATIRYTPLSNVNRKPNGTSRKRVSCLKQRINPRCTSSS